MSATINYANIDRHLRRQVRAAAKAGHVEIPNTSFRLDGPTMRCPCGYEGVPEVVVQYSEWDAAPTEYDMFVCPNCGDA